MHTRLANSFGLKTPITRQNTYVQKPLFLCISVHIALSTAVQAFELRDGLLLQVRGSRGENNNHCSTFSVLTILFSIAQAKSGSAGALHTHTFIADGAESSPPPVTLIALILTTLGGGEKPDGTREA